MKFFLWNPENNTREHEGSRKFPVGTEATEVNMERVRSAIQDTV
jgi:hypothetical protein